MNFIDIRLIGEPNEFHKATATIEMGKNYVYVDEYRKTYFINEEEAVILLENYGEDMSLYMLGDSEIGVIYPKSRSIRVDGFRYIVGDYLITKVGDNLDALNLGEVARAAELLGNEMEVLSIGGKAIPTLRVI